MQNLMMKARAGRRMALMLRSIHRNGPAIQLNGYAPASNLQTQGPAAFLKRIDLSENRVSKLSLM